MVSNTGSTGTHHYENRCEDGLVVERYWMEPAEPIFPMPTPPVGPDMCDSSAAPGAACVGG